MLAFKVEKSSVPLEIFIKIVLYVSGHVVSNEMLRFVAVSQAWRKAFFSAYVWRSLTFLVDMAFVKRLQEVEAPIQTRILSRLQQLMPACVDINLRNIETDDLLSQESTPAYQQAATVELILLQMQKISVLRAELSGADLPVGGSASYNCGCCLSPILQELLKFTPTGGLSSLIQRSYNTLTRLEITCHPHCWSVTDRSFRLPSLEHLEVSDIRCLLRLSTPALKHLYIWPWRTYTDVFDFHCLCNYFWRCQSSLQSLDVCCLFDSSTEQPEGKSLAEKDFKECPCCRCLPISVMDDCVAPIAAEGIHFKQLTKLRCTIHFIRMFGRARFGSLTDLEVCWQCGMQSAGELRALHRRLFHQFLSDNCQNTVHALTIRSCYHPILESATHTDDTSNGDDPQPMPVDPGFHYLPTVMLRNLHSIDLSGGGSYFCSGLTTRDDPNQPLLLQLASGPNVIQMTLRSIRIDLLLDCQPAASRECQNENEVVHKATVYTSTCFHKSLKVLRVQKLWASTDSQAALLRILFNKFVNLEEAYIGCLGGTLESIDLSTVMIGCGFYKHPIDRCLSRYVHDDENSTVTFKRLPNSVCF